MNSDRKKSEKSVGTYYNPELFEFTYIQIWGDTEKRQQEHLSQEKRRGRDESHFNPPFSFSFVIGF